MHDAVHGVTSTRLHPTHKVRYCAHTSVHKYTTIPHHLPARTGLTTVSPPLLADAQPRSCSRRMPPCDAGVCEAAAA
jgi:hypothetical protein